MTYKPRLHHFTRLLMSVAVGLSFTGCGNSSNGSDGGSTGPTLIDKGYKCAYFKGVDSASTFQIEIFLQSDGKLGIGFTTGREGETELFIGSWIEKQLSKNTYQIIPSSTELGNGTCKMICKAPLTLTIPEGQLEDYRKGDEVTGATLYVDFTHEPKEGQSCPLNQGSPWTIEDTMTGNIEQSNDITIPSGTL